MLTRHEDVRSHEYFDIPPSRLDKVWLMYWPNNETKTVFLFREKDATDAPLDYVTDTVGQPAGVTMQEFGSAAATGKSMYTLSTVAAEQINRSAILPTPEITLGGSRQERWEDH